MLIDHTQDRPESQFCVIPVGGLGNRLLVLASGLRFLNHNYYEKMIVHWVQSEDLDARIADMFTIVGNVAEGPFFKDGAILPLCNMPEIQTPLGNRLNIRHFGLFRSRLDDINADLIPEYKHALQTGIKFNSFLVDIANSFDVSDCIGIHCRRTDFWSTDPERAARMYHRLDNAMIEYIKTTYPNDKIFLSSDSPFTLVALENEFGERLIHYPKQNYPIWRLRKTDSMKEAIVDHILLGRCKKIVSDSKSTFSLTAAWCAGKDREQWRPQ